jgi:di/tricarboxylate transporter
VVLFFTGLPLELVALGAASVLLLGRVKPAKVYGEIDWNLLVMFTGLFIVVHAFQVHVVSEWGIGFACHGCSTPATSTTTSSMPTPATWT